MNYQILPQTQKNGFERVIGGTLKRRARDNGTYVYEYNSQFIYVRLFYQAQDFSSTLFAEEIQFCYDNAVPYFGTAKRGVTIIVANKNEPMRKCGMFHYLIKGSYYHCLERLKILIKKYRDIHIDGKTIKTIRTTATEAEEDLEHYADQGITYHIDDPLVGTIKMDRSKIVGTKH